MSLEADFRHDTAPRGRHHEIEFKLLYAALYPIFLTSAAGSRLVPWRSRGDSELPRRSIFDEARASTGRIVPMVFMG
jgi:hypothetical protein